MKNTGSSYNTALGTFDSSLADLRLANVTAGSGGRSYLSFHKVPERLDLFCRQLNDRRKLLMDTKDVISQYLLSVDAHYDLVTIHPWVNGNGRMSRLIMSHLLFEFKLIPTKINKEDKADCIQALIDSREHDTTLPFRDFMLQQHYNNLKLEIEVFQNSHEGGQKTREAILQLIRNDAIISSAKMCEQLGMNRSAITKHLKILKEQGIIHREGPDKGGKWVID